MKRILSTVLLLPLFLIASQGAPAEPAPDSEADEWTLHPVDWSDWAAVEGERYYLSPVKARYANMTVCSKHFPAGSQARKNIEAAVERINQVRNVDILFKVVDGEHLEPDQLYAHPPVDTYRVELTAFAPIKGDKNKEPAFKRLAADASAFHWVESKGAWFWGTANESVPSDAVVLAVDSEHFACGACRPMDNADDAASLGVFSAELGHSLHIGYSNERKQSDKTHFQALTGWPGFNPDTSQLHDKFHKTDGRSGFVSAYSKALLQHHYPPAKPQADDNSEFVMHEILVLPEAGGAITPQDTYQFNDYNPTDLYEASGTFFDCGTDKKPVYTMQYSDLSEDECDASTVGPAAFMQVSRGSQVRVEFVIEPAGGKPKVAATMEHDAQSCDAAFVQYKWTKILDITSSKINTPGKPEGQAAQVFARINYPNRKNEYQPDNNEVSIAVMLYSSKDACPTP